MYCNIEEKLIGKVLEAISLSDDKQKLSVTVDGETLKYGVEGDCCSSSWIEHLEVPDGVIGSVITEIEEINMGEVGGSKDHCERCKESDCLQLYQTLIKTQKGTVTLEYRNDSNGYYGGYLVNL